MKSVIRAGGRTRPPIRQWPSSAGRKRSAASPTTPTPCSSDGPEWISKIQREIVDRYLGDVPADVIEEIIAPRT